MSALCVPPKEPSCDPFCPPGIPLLSHDHRTPCLRLRLGFPPSVPERPVFYECPFLLVPPLLVANPFIRSLSSSLSSFWFPVRSRLRCILISFLSPCPSPFAFALHGGRDPNIFAPTFLPLCEEGGMGWICPEAAGRRLSPVVGLVLPLLSFLKFKLDFVLGFRTDLLSTSMRKSFQGRILGLQTSKFPNLNFVAKIFWISPPSQDDFPVAQMVEPIPLATTFLLFPYSFCLIKLFSPA